MNLKGKLIFLSSVLLILGACALVGGAAFVYFGVYNIAANRPHWEVTQSLLTYTKRFSVERRADDFAVPDLNQEELIKRGYHLYQTKCLACHGAPGEAPQRLGLGLNPNPPRLEGVIEDWTAAEIAWIIANGLKMAGMPAFSLGETADDIWALTAFVVRMNTLTPQEYKWMGEDSSSGKQKFSWLPPKDQGWEKMSQLGDIERGRTLLNQLGCISCHDIPGVSNLPSFVGPPLYRWKERHFIAGHLINNPRQFVQWVSDPQRIEPHTAMPDLKFSEQDAWDMAKYLFSLKGD